MHSSDHAPILDAAQAVLRHSCSRITQPGSGARSLRCHARTTAERAECA
jgi:hypothetical protein